MLGILSPNWSIVSNWRLGSPNQLRYRNLKSFYVVQDKYVSWSPGHRKLTNRLVHGSTFILVIHISKGQLCLQWWWISQVVVQSCKDLFYSEVKLWVQDSSFFKYRLRICFLPEWNDESMFHAYSDIDMCGLFS